MTYPADAILIDAREPEPPAPMARILQDLALPHPGQPVRWLLHREPFPLYPLLAQRRYRHASRMDADGSHVIPIHPAGAADVR